jgi:prolyl 4-hydroxylase
MGCHYDERLFMEKVTLPKQNLTPNFIGSWTMNPLSICDELIAYFELNKNKQTRGIIAGGLNLDAKNSTDIPILPKDLKLPGNEVFEKYLLSLFSCYEDYAIQWPFLTTFAKNLQVGSFNLQRYQTGQHFQTNHTERSSLSTLHRVFAWMTYLNDVDQKDGGSTFFSHYDLEIQPRKGLTLIWPAEWTHAHKGNLLNANRKYIITGWMHFPTRLDSLKLK